MKDRKAWCAILLITALLIDSPQFTMQAAVSSPFSRSAYGMTDENTQDSYRLTFYLNGGITNSLLPDSYIIEELPLRLEIPYKPGYNFAGWYMESSYTNRISQITIEQLGDLSLYAKWTKVINANYNIQMYPYTTGSKISDSSKELKDCEYGFVENIAIPGMPATRAQDYMENMVADEDQCPQGICLTEDFYLVTAYSTSDTESLGSLYVFDRKTGEYLVTLGMKKNSHLGGLTFDGRYLWICHSDTRSLERIQYSYIREIALSKPKMFVDATGMFEEYRVANMPSCITYYDGLLWVATHNAYFKSVMISYKYLDGKLVEQKRYQIPEKVQGVAFDNNGYVYLSTSFGRDKSSYLKVYKDVDALNDNPRKPKAKVEMPPCSEEILYYGSEIYILFESASSKYFEGTDGKGSSICPIDKIVTLEIDSIYT